MILFFPKKKKKKAKNIKDLWQIRLICSIYKTLAKILVSKLQKVLLCYFLAEGAFIYGRKILDRVLIANKYIHYRVRDRNIEFAL